MRSVINIETLDIMARTIWGEARDQGPDGMAGVAHTIINRTWKQTWYGRTYAEVCLKPFQFSCWNDNDPNRNKILSLQYDDVPLLMALSAASLTLAGEIPDLTNGATHYHTSGISPDWSEGKQPTIRIGDHLFYNNVK